MMKEKTIVCIGIFLILAFLTTCAFYYAGSERSAVKNGMEISGRTISVETGITPDTSDWQIIPSPVNAPSNPGVML